MIKVEKKEKKVIRKTPKLPFIVETTRGNVLVASKDSESGLFRLTALAGEYAGRTFAHSYNTLEELLDASESIGSVVRESITLVINE